MKVSFTSNFLQGFVSNYVVRNTYVLPEEIYGENLTKKIDEVKKQYDNLLKEKVDIKNRPTN